jgi:uncharacterized protein (DUF488 family)
MTIKNIFTIGYGGRQFDDFVAILLKYRIDSILDIRSNPFSRFQPRYNKANLQSLLSEQGIEYLYKGDVLGGKPRAGMFYHSNGVLNHDLINITKSYQNAIDEVITLATNYENICLLCSELNPDNCHRKTLIGKTLSKRNVFVNHINAKGDIDKHPYNNQFPTLF